MENQIPIVSNEDSQRDERAIGGIRGQAVSADYQKAETEILIQQAALTQEREEMLSLAEEWRSLLERRGAGW